MFKLIAATVLLAASSAGAEDFALPSMRLSDIRNSAEAIRKDRLPAASANLKEWTVIAYMNGKNNVEKYAFSDLEEMMSVGSTDKVAVAVEIGGLKAGKVRRMLVGKKNGQTENNTVYSEGKSDMGDYRNAAAFISWAKATFPAKRYMVILWNHGMGWTDIPSWAYSGSKSILFDEQTRNYVRTRQMGDMLRSAGGADVLVFNACVMQMAEILYEMKDTAGLIVGSEENMLGPGLDYDKLLAFLNASPSADSRTLSSWFVKSYSEYFAKGDPRFGLIPANTKNIGATLSAVNPQAVSRLPQYLDAFSKAVMAANDAEAVKYAISKTIRFGSIDAEKYMSSYGDLGQFALLVAEKSANPQVKSSAQALVTFIDRELVTAQVGLHTDKIGDDYTRTHGVAIEIPRRLKGEPPFDEVYPENRYQDLSLSKASNWDEFVKWARDIWTR